MANSNRSYSAINNANTNSNSPPQANTNETYENTHGGLSRTKFLLLFSTLYFGVMLAAMDSTIVSTLMGHIASDLEVLDSISWAATGYTVAYSAFQPLYGKFSDIWGRKTVSIFCTIMFAIGCWMCGIANGLGLLVAGRFVSGFGAGGMLSMSTVTVSDYVSLRSRGIFQGIGNIAFGIGAGLGGVLGSLVTKIAGWKAAFLFQVPLIVISALAQYVLLQHQVQPSAGAKLNTLQRIDWVGSFSLVSSLLLVMLAITTGGSHYPWFSLPIITFTVVGLLLLVLFVYWEKYRAVEPIIPIPILMHRTIASACLTNFFGSGMVYAFLFYGPIFLQSSYHYSYVEVGHRILVNFVGVAIGSLGTGLIMRRTGKYYTIGNICCGSMCLGSLILLATPLVGERIAETAFYQSISYFLTGLGYSGMLTVTLLALIAAVDPAFQATTTAAQYTFRGAGSSLGIAAAGAVFHNVLVKSLVKRVGTSTEEQLQIIEKVSKSLEAIWDVPQTYLSQVLKSYEIAGLAVFGLCLVAAVLTLISSASMGEHDLERKPSVVNINEQTPLSETPRN